MRLLRGLVPLLVLGSGLVACSDDSSEDAASTTVAPPTTAAPTTVAPSTSTTAAPTTTTGCSTITNTDPVEVNWPAGISTLYGDDVDTGGHECFERVVLNLAGAGELPGYSVRYVADPLAVGTSGAVVDLRGDANLVISVGSWMGEGGTFTGERQLFPQNVSNIREVTLIDNFGGAMIWGVGLDRERPFEVFTLTDPVRIVVDIAS